MLRSFVNGIVFLIILIIIMSEIDEYGFMLMAQHKSLMVCWVMSLIMCVFNIALFSFGEEE